jgi:hypothetical protein
MLIIFRLCCTFGAIPCLCQTSQARSSTAVLVVPVLVVPVLVVPVLVVPVLVVPVLVVPVLVMLRRKRAVEGGGIGFSSSFERLGWTSVS